MRKKSIRPSSAIARQFVAEVAFGEKYGEVAYDTMLRGILGWVVKHRAPGPWYGAEGRRVADNYVNSLNL